MHFAVGDLVFCTDITNETERIMCSYGPPHAIATAEGIAHNRELKSLRLTRDQERNPYTYYYGMCGLITRVKLPPNNRAKGLYEILIDGKTYIAEDYVIHRHMVKTIDHTVS